MKLWTYGFTTYQPAASTTISAVTMKASNDLTPRAQAETHQTSPIVSATRMTI